MIQAAIPLFLLQQMPWSRFEFPRWQAWASLVLTTLLGTLSIPMRAGWPYLAAMPVRTLAIAAACSLVTMLVYLASVVGFLGWWMRRGGRWNGQGSMLNLIAATWLVIGVLTPVLVVAGMPVALWWLPWLYSGWIVGNALTGAIPRASLAYSMCGVLVISVAGLLLQDLTMRVAFSALTGLGAAVF
jgi:hypothetical protein